MKNQGENQNDRLFIKLAARKPTRLVLPDEGGNDHLIL